MNINPKCAVEILEIYKYLDNDLKKKFSKEYLDYLTSIKDNNYHFMINKNIPFYDNEFMEETIIEFMRIISN